VVWLMKIGTGTILLAAVALSIAAGTGLPHLLHKPPGEIHPWILAALLPVCLYVFFKTPPKGRLEEDKPGEPLASPDEK